MIFYTLCSAEKAMNQEKVLPVRARIIIEMLGSPKEHLEKTLHDYVAKLKKEPTLKFEKEDYAEANAREEGLFAAFVELELTFKDIAHLLAFCFDAMPSSVEILSPLEFAFAAKDFEGLLNDLQARLHTVDLALKNLKATNKILDTNAMNVLHNFIIRELSNGSNTIAELSKTVGIQPDKLEPYLEMLINNKRIARTGETYKVIQ